MVVHSRRGGRHSVGRRRRTQQQQRRRSQSSSDENSTDSGSVTRCVCGHTHSLGLMVQCDKCEVWQHCECMGLEQPDIPDHYYCELCKPENHKLTRYNNGSREASLSLEDVLASRNVLELYGSHSNEESSPPPPPPSTALTQTQPLLLLDKVIEEEPEDIPKQESSPSIQETPKEQESSEPEPQRSSSTPKPRATKRKITKSEERPKRVAHGRHRHTNGKRGKPRSRTSTPMRELSPGTPEFDQESHTNDSIATTLFEHFSPQARATSPPAKTRQPHPRMSISEMNRRARQILDYISSVQVELATKEENRAGHGHEDDDNDSLSSASTLPLDYEENVIVEHQTSLQIMDMLTRKLIKFQRRFGPRHRMMNEGCVSQSREESSSSQVMTSL
ncbi:uncharacterized protein B0P05DRAFT_598912 [Gilbertella persicaria]|uniref:uncharacterized protein n=1 Tax=Gilbertella persicaria TaxID=101096 RepID=UPI0022200DCB|nr:uncharacterized protein B0P05DRAFT_598912 [Gilbertella persicaria]KAI8066262.1 hypothetical protein B0P05DRAFT_598912 [Gilbertella persicaria]